MNKTTVMSVIGGLLILSVAGVTVTSSGKKRAAIQQDNKANIEKQQAPRPIRFERVQAMSPGKKRTYPGSVEASERTALSFRVDGPLTEVNVTLGQPVKRGDLLMQIDSRDFEDRIQSLEAQLAGAKAQQQNATQDYVRISGLFEEEVVPQSDYDHAKNAMASADAVVKGIKSQLTISHHALKDTSLLAPYDGTVSTQLVENHEMVKAGDEVILFQNIQWLEATVSVPENEILKRPLNGSELANVSFPAILGQQFKAHLKEWSSAVDPLTCTYAVTFKFQTPNEFKILPGMSASLSWDNGTAAETVLTVPASAITPVADGHSAVWIYDEASGRAKLRSVSVGDLVGASRITVTDGVSEGEQIVVSGSGLIHADLALKTAQ